MNEPWGLSGPEFLTLYVLGLPAALVLVFLVQGLLSRVGSRRGAEDLRLDVYEAAYLAGGHRRVAQTALAGLALRDQILVARDGHITVADGATGANQLEDAVLAAVRRTRSRHVMYRRMHGEPAMRAIVARMRDRGLLLDGSRALLWWLVLLVPCAVWVVGVVRAANGLALGRPTGILLVSLGLSLGVLIWVLVARGPARHRHTPRGRAMLVRLRRTHRSRRGRAGTGEMQLAGVAVLGFAALQDPALRAALVATPASAAGGGSGCSGGGCGSGGGGGCGGGCGG